MRREIERAEVGRVIGIFGGRRKRSVQFEHETEPQRERDRHRLEGP